MTAEDIAQEALWAAFERRDRLVDPAGERAWLLAFVRNKGRETVRQRRRGGDRLPDEYLDAAVDPSTLDIPRLAARPGFWRFFRGCRTRRGSSCSASSMDGRTRQSHLSCA